ncbi:restriction endonuclease subunit S [Massilia sp. TN1-12]|uniref:restriction endonuclease subunit S n=1 Tax=Massilia paldalensis TaxID=3377675 RepID=UPI00384CA03E
MKLVPISELFDVRYGVNLELNRCIPDPQGINFVSRSAKNNGVTGKVQKIKEVEPIEAGVLTVAGGGSVLETFVQMEPFYSGRDLYFLRPLIDLSLEQKLYYCMCIRANKYRYNYGRQANRTLKDIPIPAVSEIPDWVHKSFENVAKEWSGYLGSLVK